MATRLDDPFQVRPLTDEAGGGYLIEFPDLPGCLSDGETIEAAIANGADALRSWIETAREFGDAVPPPSRPSDDAYSGRWNMRVPQSGAGLAAMSRAKNQLVQESHDFVDPPVVLPHLCDRCSKMPTMCCMMPHIYNTCNRSLPFFLPKILKLLLPPWIKLCEHDRDLIDAWILKIPQLGLCVGCDIFIGRSSRVLR
jgi:antitoxin HicB